MTSFINYDKIFGLVYTEKSNKTSATGKYSFKVDKNITKNEIKSLIKKIFNVDVTKVNIINNKEKSKRFKGIIGSKKSFKKAIVTLRENQTINFGS